MIITKNDLKKYIENSEKDSHAAYEVGEYYYVQGDYAKAYMWYQKAVEGENPDSMAFFALGYASQMGEGTEVDLIQALHYYDVAAAKDIPQACYNLAYFYQNGIGVEKNQEKAVRYSERAAECLSKQTEELQKTKAELFQMQRSYVESMQEIASQCNEWTRITGDAILAEKEKEKYLSEMRACKEEIKRSEELRKKLLEDFEELKTLNQNGVSEVNRWSELYHTEMQRVSSLQSANAQLNTEKEDLRNLVQQNQKQLLNFQKHVGDRDITIQMLRTDLALCKQRCNELEKRCVNFAKKNVIAFVIVLIIVLIFLLVMIFK